LGERVNGIHEVRGSTPLGSTSLRKLRLGKPAMKRKPSNLSDT
jgi:hypothetical protein